MMLVMVSLIAVFLGLQSSSFDNFVRMYSPEEIETAPGEGFVSESEPELETKPDFEPETKPEPGTESGRRTEPRAVPGTKMKADTRVTVGSTGLIDVLHQIMSGNPEKGRELSEALKKEKIEQSEKGNRILGGSRGVLSKVINGITSGSLFVMFVSGINSLSGSKNLGSLILILLACIGVLGFYFLIVNTYTVISARMFLEGRNYEKLPVQRFVFLLRVKRWLKVSMAMLRYSIYQSLWMLTIVGGVIKYYSYAQVPYILAENPDLTGREAITLSRKMMHGHKWECFLLDFSFIGWSILGAFTLGLSEILYSLPYHSAAFCEYYVELRKCAKEAEIPGSALLDDRYLYEQAPEDVLWEAYIDVLEWREDTGTNPDQPGGIRGILADWLGILLGNSAEERAYEEAREQQVRIGMLKDAAEGSVYPGRLSRFPETTKQKKVETFHYMRHYSIWSLVLLFFIFSFIGWCWEVSLHLVLDGVFVNRGALHGPWLPIYGAGGVLLLTLLNRLRNHPVREFFCIIFVCGMVEYWTSYYLEVVYNGKKWWDYSGYFLNLNGRICAEGLLVFGIGGMMIVYIAAPLLDNLIRGMKKQILIWSCLALLCLYAADSVYSAGHPNEGKGITDYKALPPVAK